MEIIFMFVSLMLGGIGVIAYDRYKHREYYKKNSIAKKETFVFLRENNAYIRKKLREKGFNVCPCTLSYRNDYLYASLDRSIICGFNERQVHLIEDAKKNGARVIDCAKNLSAFIIELKMLDL